MRKYSKIENGELMTKYGIKPFQVTINNRARRKVYPDKIEICDEFSYGSGIPRTYSISSKLILKELPEEMKISTSEIGTAIYLPTVTMFCNDTSLLFEVVNVPIISIHDGTIRSLWRKGFNTMSDLTSEELLKSLYGFCKNNRDELMACSVTEAEVDSLLLAIESIIFSKKKSSSLQDFHSRIAIIFAMANSAMVKNKGILNYSLFFFQDNTYDLITDINGMKEANVPFDCMEDYLSYKEVPRCFAAVLRDEHFASWMDDSSPRQRGISIQGLCKYSILVQTLLAAYAVSHDIQYNDVIKFIKQTTPQWFEDEETFNSFKRFMARDLKFYGLEEFATSYNILKKANYPVTTRTMNRRCISSVLHRNEVEYLGIGATDIDAFESLLETDANKAFEFITKRGYRF